MRENIHPNYVESTVVCACGNTFKTRSTKAMIRLEICSACHPFFTGQQKFVDTAGRVERFQKRFSKTSGERVKKTLQAQMAKGQRPALSKKKARVLSSAPIRAKPLSTSRAPAKPAPVKTH
jgi:large subunit ribosomal protein L31